MIRKSPQQMDAVQQRTLAALGFMAIQFIKLIQVLLTYQDILLFYAGHLAHLMGFSLVVGSDSLPVMAQPVISLSSVYIFAWSAADFVLLVVAKLRYTARPKPTWFAVMAVSVAMLAINSVIISSTREKVSSGAESGAGAGKGRRGGLEGSAEALASLDNLLGGSSHIIGSHTVKVRPPARAKLNPYSHNYCVSTAPDAAPEDAFSLVPLIVTGIAPFYVDYTLTSPTGAVKAYSNISLTREMQIDYLREATYTPQFARTGKTPGRTDGRGKTVTLYGIETALVGRMTILGIRDAKHEIGVVSVDGSTVDVIACPQMEWKKVGAAGNEPVHRCLEDEITRDIVVMGVPPLSILYMVKSARSEQILSAGTHLVDEANATTTTPQQFSIPIKIPFEDTTPTAIRLIRVTDGLNNSIELRDPAPPASPKTQPASLPPLHLKSTNRLREFDANKNEVVVVGHAPAHAAITSENEMTMKPGEEKVVSVGMGGGAPPYLLHYEFVGAEDGVISKGVLEPTSVTAQLTTKVPGTFTLLSVSDLYCKKPTPLHSFPRSSCHITQLYAPTIVITDTIPMTESCFGEVGLGVDLRFSGEPPFWVEYVTERTQEGQGSDVKIKRETFAKRRSKMQLKPGAPGTYEYQFRMVGDANFPEGTKVPLMKHKLEQIIHAHSYAEFEPYSAAPLVTCLGDPVTLEVKVQGSGPWKVGYEISQAQAASGQVSTSPRGAVTRDVEGATVGAFEIRLDKETREAGMYSVELVDVSDVHGCTARLGSDFARTSMSVEVLAKRPSVSFTRTKTIWVLDESATGRRSSVELPMSLSGRGPFKVEIKYPNGDLKHWDVSTDAPVADRNLKIEGTRVDQLVGTYELVSVSDSVCTGTVEQRQVLSVMIVEKPFITLLKEGFSTIGQLLGKRNPVCLGAEDSIQIDISGKPPFTIGYTHTYTPPSPENSVPVKTSRSVTVDTKFLRLPMNTTAPGVHQYTFDTVADVNYKHPIQVSPSAMVIPRIQQQVNFPPTAIFIEQPQSIFYCTLNKKSRQSAAPYKLELKLTGQPPFTVKLNHKKDYQNIDDIVHNIASSELVAKDGYYLYYPPHAQLSVGLHTFAISSIEDASTCQTTYESSPHPPQISLEIADQARIVTHPPKDVCLGDLLLYGVQGTPPFTIGYTWQNPDGAVGGTASEIVVIDSELSFLAAGRGVIRIDKVCSGGTGGAKLECCDADEPAGLAGGGLEEEEKEAEAELALTTTVHDLPRAFVDEGVDWLDEVREGDESVFRVRFEGVGPFGFRYTSTRPGGAEGGGRDAAAKPVTVGVDDIAQDHWSMKTSQEGTFRVISVKDAFCEYPRRVASGEGVNRVLK